MLGLIFKPCVHPVYFYELSVTVPHIATIKLIICHGVQ